MRDYDCACGGRLIGTAQADVSRGNTFSCGCLAQESRRAPRGRHDRALTQAARQWAQAAGISVNTNGALHARVLASYRLHTAKAGKSLGLDELIPENEVRAWMKENNIQPLGRDRIPSHAWSTYADNFLWTQSRETAGRRRVKAAAKPG